ncbi:hypothetical protein FHS15_002498 [Paenibacillus castaneae]|uniref:anti-sigma factor family protein n=1 Tax=Paenibacillus castaneae TaxID=474957 RepID=UPI000C9D2576|nr:zf-HC2 domain-containing protein [Paenibacillus castaneae]NIK77362.1 hypothetical protein [Paenibacillus castaneae]
MNCQEVMELMQRQLDNDLDENEREVLMSHTRQCPDCAAMFERLKLLSAELTSLPKVMPSYSLVDAIMPQLERIELHGQYEAAAEPDSSAKEDAPEILSRRTKRSRRFPSMRIMGGVIAAGIVAGLFLVTYPPSSSPDLGGLKLFSSSESDAKADKIASTSAQDTYSSASTSEVRTESMMRNNNDSKADAMNDLDEYSSKLGMDSSAPGNPNKGLPATKPIDKASSDNSSNASEGSGKQGLVEDPAAELNQSVSGKGLAASDSSVYSLNGQYYARAEGYTIKIYAAADQSLKFETTRKNGKPANLSWSEDSEQLTYEVQVEKGAIEKYVFDVLSGEDTKAAY